jgi:predicted HTH transcriptional regulator
MKMFNLLDIGERAGSGIPSIFAVWKDQGWTPPEYSEGFNPDRTTTKLVLRKSSDEFSDEKPVRESLEKSSDKITSKEQEIVRLIIQKPSITTAEIAEQLGIPRSTVSSRIGKLKGKGIVHRIGPDNGGCWGTILKD